MRETLPPQNSSRSACSQIEFWLDGGAISGRLSGVTTAEPSGIQPRKRCWIARKYAPWVWLFRANSLRRNSCFSVSSDSPPMLVNDLLSIVCYKPSVACENVRTRRLRMVSFSDIQWYLAGDDDLSRLTIFFEEFANEKF